MRRLGISIYPEKSTKEEIFSYIDKMSELGFSRIFSCLLSTNESKEEVKKKFTEINNYAKSKGFEIIVDVSPRIFEKLDISYKDLKFFKEINADGLRLDIGFTGNEEALMTYNEYGLIIEINMSNNTHIINTIMDYIPNKYTLYGCHNFYPHVYTGLTLDYFNKCTERFNKQGLKTAAFVSSNNKGAFGPWDALDGLPTLEMHRNMPLHVQVKHLIALNSIDDIIISNCYPSEEELNNLKNIDLRFVTFNAVLNNNLSEVERKIILDELHFNRGDVSSSVIRSTQPRVKYKEYSFKLHNAPEIIKRGNIVIESELYGHYKGELQIALQDMKNTGKSNVVGHIDPEEHFILDFIKPWQKFKIKEK